MSRPNQDLIVALIVALRRVQALVSQAGPDRWRATVSEPTGGVYNTQRLAAIETSEDRETARQLALPHILPQTGFIRTHESKQEQRAAPSPWAALPRWLL